MKDRLIQKQKELFKNAHFELSKAELYLNKEYIKDKTFDDWLITVINISFLEGIRFGIDEIKKSE
jgi:hypothetical protein